MFEQIGCLEAVIYGATISKIFGEYVYFQIRMCYTKCHTLT